MSNKIHTQMLAVMKQVGAIGKNQRNSAQGYAFRGIDDLMNALHGVMAECGVYVTSDVMDYKSESYVNAKGTTMFHYLARIKHTFHADDGSEVSCSTVAESCDSSDKCANKGHSASLKYALLESFLVATSDLEDGDRTTPEIPPDSKRKTDDDFLGEAPPAPAQKAIAASKSAKVVTPEDKINLLKLTMLKTGDPDKYEKLILKRLNIEDISHIPEAKISKVVDWLDSEIERIGKEIKP